MSVSSGEKTAIHYVLATMIIITLMFDSSIDEGELRFKFIPVTAIASLAVLALSLYAPWILKRKGLSYRKAMGLTGGVLLVLAATSMISRSRISPVESAWSGMPPLTYAMAFGFGGFVAIWFGIFLLTILTEGLEVLLRERRGEHGAVPSESGGLSRILLYLLGGVLLVGVCVSDPFGLEARRGHHWSGLILYAFFVFYGILAVRAYWTRESWDYL